MSNRQTAVRLKPPSEAYQEATCSLVYRLSELMFGSLLAAYSLGFIGAIATHGTQTSAHRYWGMALLAAQYASISVAFVYLTTSLYMTYHVGILTMPQLPFARLGKDFSLAITQAVLFGFSMVQPALFPILLGINFHMSANRKDKEYEELARRLFEEICDPKGRNVPHLISQFSRELAQLLRREDFPQLATWAPIGSDVRQSIRKAIGVGITVIIVCLMLESLTYVTVFQNSLVLEIKWMLQQGLITAEVVWGMLRIRKHGSEVVEQRASFVGFPINTSGYELEPTREARNLRAKVQVKRANMKADIGQASNFKVAVSYLLDKPKGRGRSLMDEEFENLQFELRNVCKKLLPPS